jgi:hypothetical protein
VQALAAGVAAAGLLLTLHALAQRGAIVRRIGRRAADGRELQALGRVAARQVAVLDALRAEAAHPLVPLAQVVAAAVPDAPAEVREREALALAGGWTVRRVGVTLREVPFDAVGQILQAAETRRPPWRLAECLLVSGAQSNTAARAELVFEAARLAAE